MTPHIEVFVEGIPKGQPRARAFAKRGMVRMYDPGTAEGWKGAIALALRPYLPTEPIQGPVWLELEHTMPRPKSHYTGKGVLKPTAPVYHVSKPDADNLLKAAMDALTQLGMWHDDDQVCQVRVTKKYGERPGALIRIVAADRLAARDAAA